MRVGASIAVTVQILSLLIMSPCSAVGGYLHFGGTCYLHLQERSEDGSQQSHTKRW